MQRGYIQVEISMQRWLMKASSGHAKREKQQRWKDQGSRKEERGERKVPDKNHNTSSGVFSLSLLLVSNPAR